MKIIGEISSSYHISNRMLRYYEQKGILSSQRMNNNYRYYNEEQEDRVKHILLLRELKLTITEIEELFNTHSVHKVIEILKKKKSALKSQIHDLLRLDRIIHNLIYLLNTSEKPIYESLKLSINQPKKILKGENMLEKNEVRIVKIPQVTVACFKCVSETPEDDVTELVKNFVSKHGLTNFRHFGFNNPNPQQGSNTYGYEMWVTIDQEYKDIETRRFSGGLYASVVAYMPEIGKRWNHLLQFVEQSDEYDIDYTEQDHTGVSDHQWLEECSNYERFFDPQIDFTTKQLDLLLPIKEIN